MFSIFRRVRWNGNVSTRGTIHFRPNATAQKSRPAKPPRDPPRVSRNPKFPGLSNYEKFLIIFCLVYFSNKYGSHITEYYHGIIEARFGPPYLPIESAREIRVLVLEPGKAGDTISCRLKHVSLSTDPEYEALSYTWGERGKKGYIRCDGEQVAIRQELFDALEALRRPNRERILWVDAICINQCDQAELGQQVTIMGDIYASSQQVLIWLGKGTSKTADVLKVLKKASKDSVQSHGASGLGHSQADTKEIFGFDWSSASELFDHSYFHRAWTLQEMIKAPAITIHHGDQSISQVDYERGKKYFEGPIKESFENSIGRTPKKDLSEIHHNGNLRKDRPEPYLKMVVSNSPARGATNPRDHIYAFRSISTGHDGSDWELLPDYEASVEEVYSRFARWNLLKKQDLNYLAHSGLPIRHETTSMTHNFPSWVADWTRKERLEWNQTFSGNINQYKAGSALKPSILWKPKQPRLLFIKGRVVDQVNELAVNWGDLEWYYELACQYKRLGYMLPILQGSMVQQLGTKSWGQSFAEVRQAISKFGPVKGPFFMQTEVIWMENCKAIALQGADFFSPARFDAFCRTMLRDRIFVSDIHDREAFQEYGQLLDLVRLGQRLPYLPSHELILNLLPPGSLKMPENDQQLTESEFRSRSLVLMHLRKVRFRRFCLTAEGRLGFVPDCARPGDLICVFDGADVPHVIRPRAKQYPPPPGEATFKSDPEYVLVGECYMQDLMNGEALTRKDLESKFLTLS